MDLNELLRRHQISLMQGDRSRNPEERDAHKQFASDCAERIRATRAGLGAPASLRGPVNETAVKEAHEKAASAACITARVVLVPSDALTYTVVMDRAGEESSRLSFETMREAEAHVRQVMPSSSSRSTLYDRNPDEA